MTEPGPEKVMPGTVAIVSLIGDGRAVLNNQDFLILRNDFAFTVFFARQTTYIQNRHPTGNNSAPQKKQKTMI
ncbi:hypothetical protein ACTL6P_22145 [Endozoicomonas acroporae]|uniref:hypothetical protein n=1 Tax=Endozoicomonas acroporae TaxID=1701104 RepID=UPI0011AF70F0|nr:hypothetical protein [Endozoicomonas acroporae]